MPGRSKGLLKPWKGHVTLMFPKAASSGSVGYKGENFITTFALDRFSPYFKSTVEKTRLLFMWWIQQNCKFLKLKALTLPWPTAFLVNDCSLDYSSCHGVLCFFLCCKICYFSLSFSKCSITFLFSSSAFLKMWCHNTYIKCLFYWFILDDQPLIGSNTTNCFKPLSWGALNPSKQC